MALTRTINRTRRQALAAAGITTGTILNLLQATNAQHASFQDRTDSNNVVTVWDMGTDSHHALLQIFEGVAKLQCNSRPTSDMLGIEAICHDYIVNCDRNNADFCYLERFANSSMVNCLQQIFNQSLAMVGNNTHCMNLSDSSSDSRDAQEMYVSFIIFGGVIVLMILCCLLSIICVPGENRDRDEDTLVATDNTVTERDIEGNQTQPLLPTSPIQLPASGCNEKNFTESCYEIENKLEEELVARMFSCQISLTLMDNPQYLKLAPTKEDKAFLFGLWKPTIMGDKIAHYDKVSIDKYIAGKGGIGQAQCPHSRRRILSIETNEALKEDIQCYVSLVMTKMQAMTSDDAKAIAEANMAILNFVQKAVDKYGLDVNAIQKEEKANTSLGL